MSVKTYKNMKTQKTRIFLIYACMTVLSYNCSINPALYSGMEKKNIFSSSIAGSPFPYAAIGGARKQINGGPFCRQVSLA